MGWIVNLFRQQVAHAALQGSVEISGKGNGGHAVDENENPAARLRCFQNVDDHRGNCHQQDERDPRFNGPLAVASQALGNDVPGRTELTRLDNHDLSLFVTSVVLLLGTFAATSVFTEALWIALFTVLAMAGALTGMELLFRGMRGRRTAPPHFVRVYRGSAVLLLVQRDRLLAVILGVALSFVPGTAEGNGWLALYLLGGYAGCGCGISFIREAVRFLESWREARS